MTESVDDNRNAQEIIYADSVDAAVEACQLDSWDKWASRALSTNMNWDFDADKRLFKFLNKIIGAVWPKTLIELECALKTLASDLHEAIQTFIQHCTPSKTNEETMVEERFYRSQGWIENEEAYKQLFNEYDIWQNKCKNHVIEATKAANWLADVVRRDLNPLFFATKGKFFVIEGPYDRLEFRSHFYEYTEEEKKKIMNKCLKDEYFPAKFQSKPNDE